MIEFNPLRFVPFALINFNHFPCSLAQRYPRARQGLFDGDARRVTEMDALVASLQMLGTLVQFRDVTPEQLRQQ